MGLDKSPGYKAKFLSKAWIKSINNLRMLDGLKLLNRSTSEFYNDFFSPALYKLVKSKLKTLQFEYLTYENSLKIAITIQFI